MTIDWEAMFVKYSNVVGEAEGIDFLRSWDWTPEEWEAILYALDRHQQKPDEVRFAEARKGESVLKPTYVCGCPEGCAVPGPNCMRPRSW